MEIHTIDLNFQDSPGIIASYLLPHEAGALLIESGPGSTIPALEAGLARHGYSPADITDLFVTHIHLDHAGASGWLAGHGARVHVHPRGLSHLADPSRLLASASQIYGADMDRLWGRMFPVPADQLVSVSDGEITSVGGIDILAVETPGHASHHHAYLVGDVCFSGDIGGVRLAGPAHIVLPMPPPEFHLETWAASCAKLLSLDIGRIAPTHFGIYPDAAGHLAMLRETLADTGRWLESVMPVEGEGQLESGVTAWMAARAAAHGLDEAQSRYYEIANPSYTSAWGIARYWQKYRVVKQEAG